MYRFLRPSRHQFAVSSVAFAGVTRQCSSIQSQERQHPDHLSVFGLGDIPSSAYKAHFSDAHNAAAAKSTANVAQRRSADDAQETQGEKVMRKGIARHLMCKLGYTQQELEFLGDDTLRMQGVRSPFPAAALRAGEKVVDLGSGFGPDAFLAASKVGNAGSVIGINLSADEVQRAALRAQERGLEKENCRFVVADMEDIPLDSSVADVVISNGGFCLCPNKLAAFQEVHRLLRPGGRMAISCTVVRNALPALEGKRWPPCMEVFMKHGDIDKVLRSLGFSAIHVDENDSRMDVWDLDSSDLDTVAGALGVAGASAAEPQMCSHAKKAAERRAKQEVETFLAKDREAGIHWGNPQFDHIQEFDMSELCARVVIYAEKPE